MGNTFRENLRNEISFQDITVKELSAKTGIPVATLDCYLGIRATVPSVDAAFKIAQALKVSIEYLVSGEDSSAANSNKTNENQELRNLIKIIKSLNPEQCRAVYDMILLLKQKK